MSVANGIAELLVAGALLSWGVLDSMRKRRKVWVVRSQCLSTDGEFWWAAPEPGWVPFNMTCDPTAPEGKQVRVWFRTKQPQPRKRRS